MFHVCIPLSHLTTHELGSLFRVLLCVPAPRTSAWRRWNCWYLQDVGVDDLSSFLCSREAERGDHGQEDLVLHPREKPASG